jgi:hypothetical protein
MVELLMADADAALARLDSVTLVGRGLARTWRCCSPARGRSRCAAPCATALASREAAGAR